jgi:hypothetical protein
MPKQLLIERTGVISVPRPMIIESLEKNDGRLIVKNVLLQRADTPNKNKRIYPKRILERELNEYFKKIRAGTAYSELDHPTQEPECNIVSLKNVCQAIIDARWRGNEIYGDLEIFEQDHGAKVREWLLKGYRVGQSSRGLGSIKPLQENDLVEVQDDFEIITLADCVSDPSTHDADMSIGENCSRTNDYLNESVNVNNRYNRANLLLKEIMAELTCSFK